MMATITVNLSVQVSGGPQISMPPQKIEVESYEKLEFKFKHEKDKDKQEETFPVGSGVEVLLIKSNLDELKVEKKPKITYKISNQAAPLTDGGAPTVATEPPEIELSGANLYLKNNFAIFGSGDRQMTVTVDFTETVVKPAATDTTESTGTTPSAPTDEGLFKEVVMVEVLVGRNIASHNNAPPVTPPSN
jgi:hypothetical protein